LLCAFKFFQTRLKLKLTQGTVQPPELLEASKAALDEMKAGYSSSIQIETTHFVCTSPSSSPDAPNASQLYQKALQLSIPTVVPSWLEACKTEKKLVPISKHYLGTASTSSVQSSSSSSNTRASTAPSEPIASSSSQPPSYHSETSLPAQAETIKSESVQAETPEEANLPETPSSEESTSQEAAKGDDEDNGAESQPPENAEQQEQPSIEAPKAEDLERMSPEEGKTLQMEAPDTPRAKQAKDDEEEEEVQLSAGSPTTSETSERRRGDLTSEMGDLEEVQL
jgi:hypothetical protein